MTGAGFKTPVHISIFRNPSTKMSEPELNIAVHTSGLSIVKLGWTGSGGRNPESQSESDRISSMFKCVYVTVVSISQPCYAQVFHPNVFAVIHVI